MKRLLLALALVLALAVPAFATPMPITSLADLTGPDVTVLGMRVAYCVPDDMATAFQFVRNDKPYRLVLVQRGMHVRFFLMDLSTGENTPVWVGHEDDDGKLIVDKEYRYSQLENQAVCTFLYPSSV